MMPTEIPLKQWLAERGVEIGLSAAAIRYRLVKHKAWRVKLRRVNQRVIFVILNALPPKKVPLSRWRESYVPAKEKLRRKLVVISALANREMEFSKRLGYPDIPTWK